MKPGHSEPNEHYRPWLESNIGEQGVDWQWYIDSVNSRDGLMIEFRHSEHAVLFELSWAR
jgi:hypothetical protein